MSYESVIAAGVRIERRSRVEDVFGALMLVMFIIFTVGSLVGG